MSSAFSAILLFLIHAYRATVSPLLGPTCRFTPTCSRYMETALRRFGPWKGGWLGVRRIARCHPWGGSGEDPVPAATTRPAEIN